MRALADQIARIAPSAAPVFVFGAPGTGKAGVARAVHERSRRRGGPFVTVDCVGRESDDLLAALGAPGGAFDMADGGTLFLDEIGDLPDAVQALLLRAIETGEIGGVTDRRPVGARLVVSTNRKAASGGRAGLRADLYYRLAVLTLEVPTLAERREDFSSIVDDMARRAARETGRRALRFTAAARERLERHDWPGNLRELRNVIEQLSGTAGVEAIDAPAIDALLGPAESVSTEPEGRRGSGRCGWRKPLSSNGRSRLSGATSRGQRQRWKSARRRSTGNVVPPNFKPPSDECPPQRQKRVSDPSITTDRLGGRFHSSYEKPSIFRGNSAAKRKFTRPWSPRLSSQRRDLSMASVGTKTNAVFAGLLVLSAAMGLVGFNQVMRIGERGVTVGRTLGPLSNASLTIRADVPAPISTSKS